MIVDQLMTRNVRTCRPDDDLAFVARLMWEGDLGAVPVVDTGGRVIAMVTDRDVAMAAYLQGLPLAQIRVSTTCSHEVFVVRLGEPIVVVEHVMRMHRVRRVPIVDADGHVAGIVSLHDLARHHRGGWERDPTTDDDLARTLSVISEPRLHVPS